MGQPVTEADIEVVFRRYEAREITKMQACAMLGIVQTRFEELMRERGVSATSVRPTEFLSSKVITPEARAKAEQAWKAAMAGRQFDQFRVSADPRRLVAPGTFVPTTSPLVSR